MEVSDVRKLKALDDENRKLKKLLAESMLDELARKPEIKPDAVITFIHDMTNFPEETVLYFTNFGPIRYIDDDDNTVGFLDWQGVLRAAEESRTKIAT